jgi:anaerobic selenocysteine-containing dehydrogenase
VSSDDLQLAARLFAGAERAYAACGVGPGFSQSTTLVEYLVCNLTTLCGHYLRSGEHVARTPTLLPPAEYRAQVAPPRPAYGYGESMLATSLTETSAGMPTAALADEILFEDERRVRALLSVGGNPVGSWPDQLKVAEAMRSLELLVQFDPWMSSTSRLADYVIAPRLSYEVPGMTLLTDFIISMPTWYGPHEAYADYTPAIVDPPPGSDVIAEWEFLFGVAQRMGVELVLRGYGLSQDGKSAGRVLDMERTPSGDEVLEMLADGARVALDEVKRHPSGATFPEPAIYVQPKQPGWTGRFDLANADMMRDLSEVRGQVHLDPITSEFPYRLICHRVQHVINSCGNDVSTNRGRSYNPLFMHPTDLETLGLIAGDVVEIRSQRAAISAVVQPEKGLRKGHVAMTHGFGDTPDRDDEFRQIGSPVGRLLDTRDVTDRYTGMPRMSNDPDAVHRLAPV